MIEDEIKGACRRLGFGQEKGYFFVQDQSEGGDEGGRWMAEWKKDERRNLANGLIFLSVYEARFPAEEVKRRDAIGWMNSCCGKKDNESIREV